MTFSESFDVVPDFWATMRSTRKKIARSILNAVVKGSLTLTALLVGSFPEAIIFGNNSLGNNSTQHRVRGVANAVPLVAPIEATDPAITEVSGGPIYEITGGQTSGDGTNLFHEFVRFDVPGGQSATFITPVDIQNVLSLITGTTFNSESVIEGALGITGSNANLYLINPSGILFGENATLNLPGSFTATTATSVDFNGELLELLSVPTSYTLFDGRPTAFEFDTSSPLVNLSNNLSVNPEQNLSLIGGTVLNTGNVNAPGGNITLIATEDGSRIRINQNNQLLSFEVPVGTPLTTLTPDTLSSLLANLSPTPTNLAIDFYNGTVSLVEDITTEIPIPEGEATIAQSGRLDAAGTLDGTGGSVELFGRQIGIVDSEIKVSGDAGGGRIVVGGDNTGTREVAERVYIDNQTALIVESFSAAAGSIDIWSEGSTKLYGDLEAQGTPSGEITLTSLGELVRSGDVEIGSGTNAGTLTLNGNHIDIKKGSRPNEVEDLTTLFTAPISSNSTLLYEDTLEQIENLTISALDDITINNINDTVLSFKPGSDITFVSDADNTGGGGFSMRNRNDILRSLGGSITIIDGTTGSGIQAGAIDTGFSGSIELTGDGIDLIGGKDSVLARSLTIQTYSENTNIELANDNAPPSALDLSTSDLSAIHSETAELIVGSENGTATISLFSDVTTALAEGLSINVRGSESATLAIVDSPGAVPSDTEWVLDGENSGTFSTFVQGRFSGIGNLVSGRGDDTIAYAHPSARVNQSISGGQGDLTLTGVDMNLPNSLDGEGSLFIRPGSIDGFQSVAAVEIGGPDNGEPNVLNLTNDELSGISDRFTNIEIGSEQASGSGGEIIQTDNVTFNSSIRLRSLTGISSTGDYTLRATGEADITLEANDNVSVGTLSTDEGDITITTPSFVQATGINERGSSIETNEGSVTIEHGGNGNVPLSIGDAAVNGTAGKIAASGVTVELGQEITIAEYENGNIRIVTNAPVIEEEENNDRERPAATLQQNTGDGAESTASQTISTASILSVEENSEQELNIVLDNSESTTAAAIFNQIETAVGEQIESYLSLPEGSSATKVATLSEVQDTLKQAELQRNARSSLVYVYFVPDATSPKSIYPDANRLPQPDDRLEVMLVTATGEPIRQRQWGVTRAQVEAVAAEFRYQATSQFSQPAQYLEPAQQLYSWLIEPLQEHISKAGSNNLALIMDDGLRTLPLAALHDGEQFLVEKYSLGLMPTFSLTDFGLSEPETTQRVLAMGASEFSNQPPLPAVEAELAFISENLQIGEAFLNENFTLDNLNNQVANKDYNIVHLATHATFESGDLDNSYIQLWDQRLGLSQIQALDLGESNIDLIILSACSTAMGDRQAEYGFAGFAINAGSQSALASLWPVSDEGTLGFMTQFYTHLASDTTRSEALRQAQVAMLNGQIGVSEGQLYGPNDEILSVIPQLEESGSWDFSHPFYWSAFSMIGNPW